MLHIRFVRSVALLPVLAIVVLCRPAIDDDAPGAINLPITKAVLFSSGVGYFEHEGIIRGDQNVRLMFQTDQINDILKSMVVVDFDGGTVQGVNYAANDPLERTLRSFGVDISGKPTLPQLLDQLRGAEIIVRAPNEVKGRILNVETRTRTSGQPPVPVTEHVVNIVTDAGIRSLMLSSVDSIQLADRKLQEELNRALLTLVDSRDTEQKAVEVQFAGAGERRVRIGYLIETPVWKTSYRLDLSHEDPLLQGWAIVENTGNNDWRDVRLSLVSGRPISFVQDLYTPLYMPRPVVVPEMFASLRPQTYDRGMKSEMERVLARQELDEIAGARMRRAPAAPPAAGAGGGTLYGQPGADAEYPTDFSVQAMASGEAIGELFQFTLAHPVDMPRRQSAMLPIVNENIEAQRISIYNASVLEKHPLNGVEIKNTTDLKLLAGPVTVFDGGSYAGDAQVGHLSPGEKRLLSYAIDLDVAVDSSTSSSQRITNVRIVRGIMHVQRLHRFEREYRLANGSSRDRVLLVEHPKTANTELVQPEKAEEEMATHYRFRVDLDADSSGRFTVVEQRTVAESYALLDRPMTVLQTFVSAGGVDDEVKAALREVIEMRSTLHQLETRRDELQQELQRITAGQARLRENLRTVGNNTELGRRYLARLSSDEDTIEELEAQIARLNDEITEQRTKLEDHILRLTIRP
jgi:hypothetical protein